MGTFFFFCQHLSFEYCKGGKVATKKQPQLVGKTLQSPLATRFDHLSAIHVVWLPLMTTTKLVHKDSVFA